jgi:uracil-DNA glycosylase
MSNGFHELLDATVFHLQALKRKGVRHIQIDPQVLACLQAPPPKLMRARVAVPAPIVPPSEPGAQPAEKTALAPAHPAPGDIRDAPAPSAESAPAGNREADMAQLRARALACRKCAPLAASRKNVVFGVGDIYSPLMFVGEAPGADEDAQGEPFVGKAGQTLTKIIKTMGLSREVVYIANVLKCRPDTDQPTGNRRPRPDEMKTCLPYLLAQIDLIQPKVIVALGGVAMEGLFGRPIPIMKARGKWEQFQTIPVMPTFHPAYLLHNQSITEKRKLWEDMLKVMEKLGLPIGEKQRRYFL